jgi:hypothetical protein
VAGNHDVTDVRGRVGGHGLLRSSCYLVVVSSTGVV